MAVDIIARGMAGDAGEQAEIAQRFVVSPYDPAQTYNPNDIVSYDGKLYLCTGTNVTGTFDPSKWSQIVISSELTEIINKLATITNPMLIKGRVDTVDELPADAEPGWVYFVGTDEETNLAEYVYTEDEEWQYIGTAHVEVDDALSATSTNPVQNKVITEALNEKYPIAWDVTVTQAQYDALPDSKNYDGKHYHISDGGVAPQNIIVYGWHVNPNEGDPEAAITYLKDAVGMEPASMGASTFDYGTWGNAFFMPKPCMLKSDGTVDYYLDPNDYTKKADGTASDVANTAYDGNAMMEWPVIWWKYEAGTTDGEGYFYCSNRRVDNTYNCWCNYDANDNITGHFYTAIYNSTYYDGTMRSISGVAPSTTTKTFTEQVNAAMANNTTDNVEWLVDIFADRMLINGLLILIGKSLNTQAVFGNGATAPPQGQTAQSFVQNYTTGALNDKGLFYGDISGTNSPVKVFGMENWWGLLWRRVAGLIGLATGGSFRVKLTYGLADGTTVIGYSYDDGSTGYKMYSIGLSYAINGYISKCKFEQGFYYPLQCSGSATTYYCDYLEWHSINKNTGMFGSCTGNGVNCGANSEELYRASTEKVWNISTTLSCKPLAQSN